MHFSPSWHSKLALEVDFFRHACAYGLFVDVCVRDYACVCCVLACETKYEFRRAGRSTGHATSRVLDHSPASSLHNSAKNFFSLTIMQTSCVLPSLGSQLVRCPPRQIAKRCNQSKCETGPSAFLGAGRGGYQAHACYITAAAKLAVQSSRALMADRKLPGNCIAVYMQKCEWRTGNCLLVTACPLSAFVCTNR